MGSPELALYALSQRAHHSRCLSQLNLTLLETASEEINAPSRCPQQGWKTPPLPATPNATLFCQAPRSTSMGPKNRKGKQQPSLSRLDDLYTSQYVPPIGLERHSETVLMSSPTSPVVGLCLPFPTQSKISDLDSMFNKNKNLSGTLPIIPGGVFDEDAYDYSSASGSVGLQHTISSTPPSTVPEMGSNTGAGTRNRQFLGDTPEQAFGCESRFAQGGELTGPVVSPSLFGLSPEKSFARSATQSSYPPRITGGLSTSCPSVQPSNTFVNPLQLDRSMPQARVELKSFSSELQGPPLRTLYPSFTPTANSALEYHSVGLDYPPSASSASVKTDSWDSSVPDEDKLEEHRLMAEDMADDDELAELREMEHAGASRRAERRRLAQRAFRARAKVSKKNVASRLAEAEDSASTRSKKLKLLRTMVHTLKTENRQLKRQIKDSNDQSRMSHGGTGGQGEDGVKIEAVDGDLGSRKRSWDRLSPLKSRSNKTGV